MANPNARLKYLFLLNSEDSVKAVIKFNEFLREVGVPEDEANIERDFFDQWGHKNLGVGVLFTSRERQGPDELFTRAYVVNISKELVNKVWKPPPERGIQNKTASAVS